VVLEPVAKIAKAEKSLFQRHLVLGFAAFLAGGSFGAVVVAVSPS
jgi:hypothetical protein